ncbi:MAG: response regulator transcription factor [Bacteroidia bacterium]|nr:response regulator transcription factor [Bacteroidia bacterium]
MNCIIIEDEINSRILLQQILADYCPEVKLIGVGATVQEGILLIDTLKPDIILLDIEIVGGTGFDILDGISNKQSKIIFITGYENYALKAIRYSAIDYLLKPVSISELKAALKKIEPDTEVANKISALKDNLGSGILQQIMVPHDKGYTLIKTDHIMFLEASGAYVYFHLTDNKKILASHSLGHYEEILDPQAFFRTHKSFIVNLAKVVRVNTQNTPYVELVTQKKIDLAFRRKDSLVKRFKEINPI